MAMKSIPVATRKSGKRPARFEAIIPKAEIEAAETRYAGSGDIAVLRRVTLSAATMSQDEMEKAFTQSDADGEAGLEILSMTDAFIKHEEAALQIAKAVRARMIYVIDAAFNPEQVQDGASP